MNIYDIAKKAGVSVATVSRVINESDRVSEKSKAKVKAVIEREGYTPNVFARGLTLNTVRTVGILCPVISDINHAMAVSHLEAQLRQNGFDSLLACSTTYDEDKGKFLDLLMKKRVDAIVSVGSTVKESRHYAQFEAAAKQVPIVIVNGLIECDNIYCVLCDEETAVRDCVIGLYQRGHESIAYMYDTMTYSGFQKLSGYRRGLAECGIGVPGRIERKISTEGNSVDIAFAAMSKLLDSGAEISALVTADDILAVGAQKALIPRGIHIPIVGFNNSRFAQCADPEISSIDNMVETLCVTAIGLLMNLFKGKNVSDRVTISAKLIERATFRLQT